MELKSERPERRGESRRSGWSQINDSPISSCLCHHKWILFKEHWLSIQFLRRSLVHCVGFGIGVMPHEMSLGDFPLLQILKSFEKDRYSFSLNI